MPRSRLALAAALACALPPLTAQEAADGRLVFLQNCALCHGNAGKGDGPGAGVPPPRDLTSGRFSFGTTEEAVERTVRGGIAPGMPAFGSALDDAQIDAVVDYVRSLMPAAVQAPLEQSTVVVGRHARVVRGALPTGPVTAGEPLARGLAVGLPGGVSLEYATERDLRPLQAFRGGFVDRTDWRGRGGTPLEFLGEPVHRLLPVDTGFPQVSLAPLDLEGEPDDDAEGQPLRLRLVRTEESGDAALLTADLRSPRRSLGTWQEELAPLDGGYVRRLELTAAEGVLVDLRLRLTAGLPRGAGFESLGTHRRIRHVVRGWAWAEGAGREVLLVRIPNGRGARAFVDAAGTLDVRLRLGLRPHARCEVLRLRGAALEEAGDLATLDREVDR